MYLISWLQYQGALLNTLRPEYLLSQSDYNAYVKTIDNPACTVRFLQLHGGKFKYISYNAWITLFYQIAKVFSFSRIQIDSFNWKPDPADSKEEFQIEDHYIADQASNVFTKEEMILFKWLELNME